MSETLETSAPSTPRNSPVILLTNADYKRPSSILSSRSRGSTPCSSVAYLPVYWWGVIMLSCHFFIGTVRKISKNTLFISLQLLVLGSLFDFIWNSIDLVKPIVMPLKEIPTWMSFLLSFEILVSLLVSIKTHLMLLFGGSDRFSKYYRYKVKCELL